MTKRRLVAAIMFATSAHATPQGDAAQDYAYTMCLAKRHASPTAPQRVDVDACLSEAGVQDPGEALRGAAIDSWHRCLIISAVQLDDAVSSASDIAKVAIRSCTTQWQSYVASLHLPPSAKSQMAQGLDRYGLDDGARAVLLVRRANRPSRP